MRKKVLVYGDSNTWGYRAVDGGRFGDALRWTRQLASILGGDYEVIESGLNGRTTVFDDPLGEGRCGLTHLFPTLKSQGPLDLVVFMLGTNDLKSRFGATPENVAEGVRRLIERSRAIPCWREEPRFVVLGPPRIDAAYASTHALGEMGPDADIRSEKLLDCLAEMAIEERVAYFDVNGVVTTTELDYLHLDQKSQRPLAEAVATVIREVFA
jgi:lysophospholipase L1-like esterase